MTSIDWQAVVNGLTGAQQGGVPVTLTIVPSDTLVYMLVLLALAIFLFALV